MSPELQQEVQDLQKRMSVELKPLVLESTLTIQKILEAKDHKARVRLLKHFMDVEKKRLDAKATLQGMFAGNASAVTNTESDVIASPSKSSPNSSKTSQDDGSPMSSSQQQQGALWIDEPDAFQ